MTTTRRQRGAALMSALFLVLVFVTAGALVHAAGQRRDAAQRQDVQRAQTFWAAEGGVEHARAALARDPSWSGGTVDVGTHVVSIAVSPLGTDSDADREITVDVPGTAPTRLVVRLALGPGLPSVVAWSRR